MCKYYEYETEIECANCGKIYKKKKNPKSQMMAHSQYCPEHILKQIQRLTEKDEDGIESIYEQERVENKLYILNKRYDKLLSQQTSNSVITRNNHV